jgi:hypothetical protein
LLIFSIVLLVRSSGVTPLTANSILMQVQTQKARAKARVNRLLAVADDTFEQERCGLNNFTIRCKNAYEKAAKAYQEYVDDYLSKDKNSQEYTISILEIGEAWEKSGDDYEAKRQYLNCRKSAEDNGFMDIKYNDNTLDQWLSGRLRKIEDRLRKQEKQERREVEVNGGHVDHEDK